MSQYTSKIVGSKHLSALAERTATKPLGLCRKKDRQPQPTAQISIFADLVTVKVPAISRSAQRPGGDRQPIKEFSRSSRRNMIRRMASLRKIHYGAFITLTYPGHFDRRPDEVKRDLKAFRQRCERRFKGGLGAVWRMELKRRKSGLSEGQIVPHFHLMFFNYNYEPISVIRAWCAAAWNEIVAPGDADHIQHGTDATEILNRRHAMSYVSKYAGKCDDDIPGDDEPQQWGRRWGMFGNLDMSVGLVVTIPLDALPEFRRMVRKWLKARHSAYARSITMRTAHVGFSCFGLGDESLRSPLDQQTSWRMIEAIITG
jgi:hypothetical protein